MNFYWVVNLIRRAVALGGHAKRGSHASLCMPHGKHYYLITPGDIVDVIASSLEEDTTRVR